MDVLPPMPAILLEQRQIFLWWNKLGDNRKNTKHNTEYNHRDYYRFTGDFFRTLEILCYTIFVNPDYIITRVANSKFVRIISNVPLLFQCHKMENNSPTNEWAQLLNKRQSQKVMILDEIYTEHFAQSSLKMAFFCWCLILAHSNIQWNSIANWKEFSARSLDSNS